MNSKTRSAWLWRGLVIGASCLMAAGLFLPDRTFWSPDEGGRYLMLTEILRTASNAEPLKYPGHEYDPEYRFYPSANRGLIYPRLLPDGGVAFNWPMTFPALTAPFYLLFGASGLYILPGLGVLLCLLFAFLLAESTVPQSGRWAAFGVALASPVFFFGLLFWEHALAAGLSLTGIAALFQSTHKQGAARYAGVFMGLLGLIAAAALRAELAIIPAAVAVTALWQWTPRKSNRAKRLGVFILLTGILLASLPVIDALIGHLYDTGLSPFRQWRLTRVLDLARKAAGQPGYAAYVWSRLTGLLIHNPERGGVPLASGWTFSALAGLALCLASNRCPKRIRLAAWLIGAGCVALTALIALTEPARYRAVHGLLLPAPWLLLALLPATGRPGDRERLLRRFAAAYLGLFALITLLLGKTVSGLEWGLRYGLPLYAFCGIVAATAFERFRRTAPPGAGRRAVATVGYCAMAIGLGMNLRGVAELRHTQQELKLVEEQVLKRGAPVVTDRWWLASSLAPLFTEYELYTVAETNGLGEWLEQIGKDVPGFLFIGETYDALDLSPDRRRWLTVDEWIKTEHLTLRVIRLKTPGES